MGSPSPTVQPPVTNQYETAHDVIGMCHTEMGHSFALYFVRWQCEAITTAMLQNDVCTYEFTASIRHADAIDQHSRALAIKHAEVGAAMRRDGYAGLGICLGFEQA